VDGLVCITEIAHWYDPPAAKKIKRIGKGIYATAK
jgi:hypothetical protein